jgi:hypothetical protein
MSTEFTVPWFSISRWPYFFGTILLVLAQIGQADQSTMAFFFCAHMSMAALRLRHMGASLWYLLAVPVPIVGFFMFYRLCTRPAGSGQAEKTKSPVPHQPKPFPFTPVSALPAVPTATFEIKIPEGRLRSLGVFELAHGTAYTLALTNPHPARQCDALVMIDGRRVGSWRIAPGAQIRLEHPAHDTGRFTCFRIGTPEAEAANLDATNPQLGTIRVKFIPEVQVFERTLNSGRADLGGTGLGEHSNQVYGSASPITHDDRAAVIREIRLVTRLAVRPLSSVI